MIEILIATHVLIITIEKYSYMMYVVDLELKNLYTEYPPKTLCAFVNTKIDIGINRSINCFKCSVGK